MFIPIAPRPPREMMRTHGSLWPKTDEILLHEGTLALRHSGIQVLPNCRSAGVPVPQARTATRRSSEAAAPRREAPRFTRATFST